MADTPRPWAILEAVQARLQTIAQASGYRTDAGADVRLEESQFDADSAPRITLYTGSNVRPDGTRARNEREFTLVVEAAVSADMDNAHRAVVDIAEDIEDALTNDYLQMPDALPPEFQESLFLQRPDGVPAMVAQLMFSVRFRR